MRIVLGLGNPGARYRDTRHNVGFRVVDRLAERHRVRLRIDAEVERKAWTATAETDGGPILLARPRTYMNRSGTAARLLCERYDAGPGDLLVVYDDADLELGRLRLRARGGPGGHRGIQSLMGALATAEFPRVKIGVRGEDRPPEGLADYVLAPFNEDELPALESAIERGADAVESILSAGLTAAMDHFNARPVTRESESASEGDDSRDETEPG